ncbi:NAD(P)H-dependent glycerol-3-phosphate dehydrogenase, partial [candidate division KSB1 bacterium]
SEVYKEVLPETDDNNIAVLSGPSFAAEVCKRFPTAVVAGSKNDDLIEEIQQVFMNKYFRVYGNNDITGVELGGSLKNVMAIAAGIVDGVGFGDNTKSALITRGIAEMTRLGMKMGSEMMTFAGLSGVGDLILTCMGKLSRNLHVGKEIGSGKKLETVLDDMVQVAEGVKTAEAVHKLSTEQDVETPIMEKVYEVLFKGKEPGKAIEELMMREAKAEH